MERERILGVAISYGQAVFKLKAPYRHEDLIPMLTVFFVELGSFFPFSQADCGFYTTKRNFADRRIGYAIARQAGQLKRDFGPGGRLTSENVW